MFIQSIKRWASKVFRTRVNDGYGLSIDDGIKLTQMPSQEIIDDAASMGATQYTLSADAGSFVMIGPIKSGNITKYQLKHLETGTVFIVTKIMLDIVFTRKSKKTSAASMVDHFQH